MPADSGDKGERQQQVAEAFEHARTFREGMESVKCRLRKVVSRFDTTRRKSRSVQSRLDAVVRDP